MTGLLSERMEINRQGFNPEPMYYLCRSVQSGNRPDAGTSPLGNVMRYEPPLFPAFRISATIVLPRGVPKIRRIFVNACIQET